MIPKYTLKTSGALNDTSQILQSVQFIAEQLQQKEMTKLLLCRVKINK